MSAALLTVIMFSETTDIWLPAGVQIAYNHSGGGTTYSEVAPTPNRYGTWGEAKHTLFLALLHTQINLDAIIGEDAAAGHLGQYDIVYVAETHLTAAATAGLAKWVAAGGTLFFSPPLSIDSHSKVGGPLRGVQQSC